MDKVFLKKNRDKRIKSGHLWIFSNEIDRTSNHPENGDLVEVVNSNGQFMGIGFYNKHSLIAVRIITKSPETDLYKILSDRFNSAFKFRKELYPNRNSFRFLFSESDLVPGLIIDKYNDSFVLQVNSFGIHENIHMVIEVLKNNFKAKNIFTKNDNYLRKLEGLPEEDEIYFGSPTAEIIDDGSIKYRIDFAQSQKTGFYFDQSDNRFFIERLVKEKTVADIFCNCGGFGLHALKAGAAKVTFVDSSEREIENVKFNLSLNKLHGETSFYAADAFDFLNDEIKNEIKYDVVMVDPPAFAKSKKSIPTALKGYEKLNKLALQVVRDGGYLVTSSCSYHIKKEDFLGSINKAATKSHKTIQMIYFNGASLDHPVLPSMEETAYLKFAVFKVLSA